MYAGPGSASLMASAAAWQALAAQLGSAGAAFQSVIEALMSTVVAGSVIDVDGVGGGAVCGVDDRHHDAVRTGRGGGRPGRGRL